MTFHECDFTVNVRLKRLQPWDDQERYSIEMRSALGNVMRTFLISSLEAAAVYAGLLPRHVYETEKSMNQLMAAQLAMRKAAERGDWCPDMDAVIWAWQMERWVAR